VPVALLAALVCSGPGLVRAQAGKPAPPAQKPKTLSQTLAGGAKADFEAGKLLAGDGDFAGALIKFQSAYDASKDPRLLWNVAFCQKNLRHYAKVVALLQRYVEEGAALLTEKDKKDALDLVSTIEPFTTRVTIQVNEASAEVFVDEEPVGTSPLSGPVILDIGQRHLRVEKAGFVKFEGDLVVGGSAETTKKVDLAREVHEGKVIIEAAAAASILVDDKPVGTGKAELTLPAGGHQLRVTAPGMRPYQSDMVIAENETRQLTVKLELEAPPEKPKLRVAVGCADPQPRAPADGLTVYTDQLEVLPPGPVKSRLGPERTQNVVEFVEYPIDPGKHHLRIVSKDCNPLEQDIDVDPVSGALVSGALPSSKFVLFRGAQGSPGWYRFGLGVWLPEAMQIQSPDTYKEGLGSMTGVSFDVGLIDRWFGLYLNGAYASGSFTRQTHNSASALPENPSAKWQGLALRFGPRFPFHTVAFGLGLSLGEQEVDIDQVKTGDLTLQAGAYAELDVQPLCDWGAFATVGAYSGTGEQDNKVFGSMQLGAFWEPNPRCRVEQATHVGLEAARK
jgi:hypothetical protein